MKGGCVNKQSATQQKVCQIKARPYLFRCSAILLYAIEMNAEEFFISESLTHVVVTTSAASTKEPAPNASSWHGRRVGGIYFVSCERQIIRPNFVPYKKHVQFYTARPSGLTLYWSMAILLAFVYTYLSYSNTDYLCQWHFEYKFVYLRPCNYLLVNNLLS